MVAHTAEELYYKYGHKGSPFEECKALFRFLDSLALVELLFSWEGLRDHCCLVLGFLTYETYANTQFSLAKLLLAWSRLSVAPYT